MSVINREHYRQELLRYELPDAGSFNRGIQCALNVLDKEPEISSVWTWISVGDRLPEVDQAIRISITGSGAASRRLRFVGWQITTPTDFTTSTSTWIFSRVTHWAPLPPLP